MSEIKKTPRSRVKRKHYRGNYDFDTVAAILDAGFICHVGYNIEGKPYVTPTSYWREGEHVYWHGSSASRMLREQSKGIDVCFTVTHVDGLVMARSAFNHSINYRSVMLFGLAGKVEGEDDKLRVLETFTEKLFPGRWSELRPVTKKELKATTVLHMPIEEGSAKIRTGDPGDDEEDYTWPVWAGVVPLSVMASKVSPCPRLIEGTALPKYLKPVWKLGPHD